MTWKEKLFLLTIPLIVLTVYWIRTPDASEITYEINHQGPDGWETVEDDPTQVINIRWLLPGSMKDQPLNLQAYKKYWNVEVEPIYLTPEAMMTAQPLMLSAGDIPDFLSPGTNENLRKYAHHGYLMEIPFELLATHAPDLVREINRFGPLTWASTAMDGHNYGFRTGVWYDGRHPRVGIWRMDWLNNVGIHEVPDTIEEYTEAFRRIRNNDPDGNGLKDTYGLTGDLVNQYVSFTEIFGAYGVMPYNFMKQDGVVVWGGIQPGAKEALTTLHQWHEEGLIHPDFLTDLWYRDINRKFTDGKIGYVNYMASFESFNTKDPNALINDMANAFPGCELAPGVPPTGPRGERGHRVWGASGGGAGYAFGKHMADRPEAVVRMVRMLNDLTVNEEFWAEAMIGRRGEHWEWKDPEVGPDSGIRFLPPYDKDTQLAERIGLPKRSYLLQNAIEPILRKYKPREMVEWNEAHRDVEWGRPDIFGDAKTVKRSEEFLLDLERLQKVRYAEFIRGERPLDEFDDFVAEWRAAGGDLLLEGAQQTYEEAQGLLTKITQAAEAARPSNREED